jgi:hypothetical protein
MKDTEKKFVFVHLYCDFHGLFSNELRNVLATGDEIYEFLMRDAQICLNDKGNSVSGDSNILYLGLTDGFGQMIVEQKDWKWSPGESSFDIIEEFVSTLYDDNLIFKCQWKALMDKIQEGRLIKSMIGHFLHRHPKRNLVPINRVIEDNMKTIRRKHQSSVSL